MSIKKAAPDKEIIATDSKIDAGRESQIPIEQIGAKDAVTTYPTDSLLLSWPTSNYPPWDYEALNEFEGAIILVSHDPHLIRLVADHLWLVEDGNCQPFNGDLVNYEQLLLKNRRAKVSKTAALNSSSKENTNIKRKQPRLTRNKLSTINKRATDAENKMIQLSKIIKELEFRLIQSETYQNGGLEAKTIQKELGSIKKALFEEEAVWLDAQETLEDAGLRLK